MLRPTLEGKIEEVSLEDDRTERTIKVATNLGEDVRVNLISLLRDNANVFAFSIDEMPVIDPEFLVYRLNVNEEVSLVKQKKRHFSTEKNAAIKEEVDKLVVADFIEPRDYPEWLANVVMVKKANGADVCESHGLEQSMHQGLLPTAEN